MGALSMVGRPIVRKYAGPVATDAIDLANVASVEVTSEQALYPVDHLFDGLAGQGGSCWVASAAGMQAVTLHFHEPIDVGTVVVESEERWDTRVQHIDVTAMQGSGPETQPVHEGKSCSFDYAPYRASFHRATWAVAARGVTQLRIRVTPTPLSLRATLTSVIVRG